MITGVAYEFDVSDVLESRALPEKLKNKSGEIVCWKKICPLVSKFQMSCRWPACCCTSSFGTRKRTTLCVTLIRKRSLAEKSRSKELVQQQAGQRQDIWNLETSGQIF